jgi:hypothetical protein
MEGSINADLTRRWLVPEVYADIKSVVIPIRMVIAAPLPIRFHAVNIMPHLVTISAVPFGIVIDPCAISLKPIMAITIPIAKCGAAH